MTKLRIGSFVFSPALVPSLAFLIVCPVLISLGLWQLDRAEEKREIERQVSVAMSRAPLNINLAAFDTLPAEVYRPAVLQGRFDNDRQYLWDNKTSHGKSGYQVLTPFLLEGSDRIVMVNRGWIPILGRRDQFSDITVASNPLSIVGVIKQPSNAIQLATSESARAEAYPHLVQAFEPSVIASELKRPVAPVLVELDVEDKHGFVRDWQPYYGKIGKHVGYAVQWFLMALIVVFLYIKLNLKRLPDGHST